MPPCASRVSVRLSAAETNQQSAGGIFFKFPLSPAPISRKSLRITSIVPYNVILVAGPGSPIPTLGESVSQ